MRKLGRYVWVFALIGSIMAVTGCSSPQAEKWSQRILTSNWVASYQVIFHQEDGDLIMQLGESRHETLLLEVTTPGGAVLTREFNEGVFSSDLDGKVQWANHVGYPPVWSLYALAMRVAASPELTKQGEWLTFDGFSVRIIKGGLAQVKYLDQWTLTVESIDWH